jgi:hypothetical protein
VPAALQASVVHALLSSQSTGPGTQAPPAHESPTVQELPSLQLAVFGVPMHRPLPALHVSVVQTLPSSQFG